MQEARTQIKGFEKLVAFLPAQHCSAEELGRTQMPTGPKFHWHNSVLGEYLFHVSKRLKINCEVLGQNNHFHKFGSPCTDTPQRQLSQ